MFRFKQQYRITTKHVAKRKRSMCTVDDSVLTTFQTTLNEVFVEYEDRDLIMNSDSTRVPQSLIVVSRCAQDCIRCVPKCYVV